MKPKHRMPRPVRRAVRPFAAWLVLPGILLPLGGCLAPGSVVQPAVPSSETTRQVKIGGAGQSLGEVEEAAVSPEELVRKVHSLLVAHRPGTAAHWIERYPDVALSALRDATALQANDPALRTIARVHEEQCCRADPGASWQALLKDRARRPEHYANYDAARQQIRDHLRQGRLKEAAALGVPTTPPGAGVLVDLDAYQLSGQAHLLNGQPGEAAERFTQALKLAQPGYPYQAAQLQLLLSEAQRRCGKEAEAVAAWQTAAELAAGLLAKARPVADPLLWERLAYLQPVRSSWPAVVAQQFSPNGAAPPLRSEDALVWLGIGQGHLVRNEPQAALRAFKRAESMTDKNQGWDGLQLAEARALAQLDQPVAATAILVRLAQGSPTETSSAALALLGALKFKAGQTQQALLLLQRAVEQDAAERWPGRPGAEADLALAYLTSGDEANGMRWLHAAQQRFAASKDDEQLLQALGNEAAYLDYKGKTTEARALRQRAQELEGSRTPGDT